ncbi:uncharacterized protein MYCFIDRAFT_172678 [Pseudocercospora fijiensis CIRAD86]|uniref:G protein-coupled receptor GPR1/2/3 C-terminal domain-containing protein n=1 Tax=Pseudocercospora fijiensis (strain CIRAD86) TaxID=383855 RepID=M3A7D8_PSEFD|nr:uncharacterized protein MYCFIDRAFT_172678 [Pseudocercospora fijiensis CIRAD86]EME87004.1 hypothetical protein MYCFIDRAFT_172678 [Pseudocercospora fijiensis CIRAD86]
MSLMSNAEPMQNKPILAFHNYLGANITQTAEHNQPERSRLKHVAALRIPTSLARTLWADFPTRAARLHLTHMQSPSLDEHVLTFKMLRPGSADTQSPLPDDVRAGIVAISAAAIVSAVSSSGLLAYLGYRVLTWKHRSYARINQYVALLLNLVLSDVQQAVGFSLGTQWLRKDGIFAQTPTCWAQGWLLNAGDVGIALFTLALAVHLFADVVFDKRLSYAPFLFMIVSLWTFAYFLSTIGVVIHPRDFYMRAGVWCWINEKYLMDRLWIHYIWLILTQATVIIVYTLMFAILWRRVRSFFYSTPDTRMRAESAARSIIMYPIAYVACTLPAVIARLKIMAGGDVGYAELTVAGFLLASNGWIDVLLYTVSRRTLIFGPAITKEQVGGLDTFTIWNEPEMLPGKMELFSRSRDSTADMDLPRATSDSGQRLSEVEANAGFGRQTSSAVPVNAAHDDRDSILPVRRVSILSEDGRLKACRSFAEFERNCPTLQKLEEDTIFVSGVRKQDLASEFAFIFSAIQRGLINSIRMPNTPYPTKASPSRPPIRYKTPMSIYPHTHTGTHQNPPVATIALCMVFNRRGLDRDLASRSRIETLVVPQRQETTRDAAQSPDRSHREQQEATEYFHYNHFQVLTSIINPIPKFALPLPHIIYSNNKSFFFFSSTLLFRQKFGYACIFIQISRVEK